MKQIRKISAIILAVVMLFSLASCSLVDASETDITTDNIKIGVMLSGAQDAAEGTASICTDTINKLTDLGYGIKADRFRYAENVDPADAAAVADAYKTLINFECNMIIASDAGYMDDTAKAADEHPDVLFLVYNGQGNGKNVFSYGANVTAASYLAGVAAGLKAAELKVPKLGYVIENEANLTTVNAYYAGAKSVNPEVKLTAVTGDAEAAAQKLVTEGCVVLASDFGSEAIAKAANDAKIFFCGFGTEAFNTEDYKESFLCAPVYSFTQFFIDTIKTVTDIEVPEENEEGKSALDLIVEQGLIKDFAGGLKTGSTYISDINPLTAAEGSREAVKAASAKLLSGELSFTLEADKAAEGITIVK